MGYDDFPNYLPIVIFQGKKIWPDFTSKKQTNFWIFNSAFWLASSKIFQRRRCDNKICSKPRKAKKNSRPTTTKAADSRLELWWLLSSFRPSCLEPLNFAVLVAVAVLALQVAVVSLWLVVLARQFWKLSESEKEFRLQFVDLSPLPSSILEAMISTSKYSSKGASRSPPTMSKNSTDPKVTVEPIVIQKP